MSRSTHIINKGSCSSMNCLCIVPQAFRSYGGHIDTRYNSTGGKTSISCIFPTPGNPNSGYDFASFYTAQAVPTASFSTSQLNPVATELLVTPAQLPFAAVFTFTSFTVTNLEGFTTQYLSSPYIISVQQPGSSTTLPNLITDIPLPTLTGYMFGSFDQILLQVFGKAPINFQVLTNPNEILLGCQNLVQIIWPQGYEWSLTFIGPEIEQVFYSRLYTYTSRPPQLSYVVIDQNMNLVPNMNMQVLSPCTNTTSLCTEFSVFDKPNGYITARQPFDMTFPSVVPVCYSGMTGTTGPIGVTGVTGDVSTGMVCVTNFTVDNNPVIVNSSCLCVPIYREDDTTGEVGTRVDGIQVVSMLNAMFRQTRLKGWQAQEDIFYPYFRITYPNNILQYTITLKKAFFKANGTRNSCFDEIQIYRQGALSEFIKNSSINGSTVVTTNSMDIMDGISWCVATDINGCLGL